MSGSDIRTCMGYQQITALSSAVGLTLPSNADGYKPVRALIIAKTQAVRWRDDGTDPSATVGMPLAVGDVLDYDGDLNKIKFIEQAASAELNISFYR